MNLQFKYLSLDRFLLENYKKPVITLCSLLILSLIGCGGSGNDGSTQVVPYEPPVVNAGFDQEANEQTLVSLQGSVTEGSAAISSSLWTQTSGTLINISDANSPTLTLMLPPTTVAIELSFDFSVIDSENVQVVDSVTISVLPVNDAPIVDAGINFTVSEQSLVELSGSAVDQDGSISSYNWEQISGPRIDLLNSDSPQPSFLAPQLINSTVVQLPVLVRDNEGATATDSVNVSIIPIPEVIVTFPGNGLYTSNSIDVAGRIDEYPGDYNAITVTVTSNGSQQVALVNQEGNWRANNFPLLDFDGQHIITIRADDGAGFSDMKEIILDIGPDLEILVDNVGTNEDLGFIYGFSFNIYDEKLYVNSAIDQNQENLKFTTIDPSTPVQTNIGSPTQGHTALDTALQRLLIVKPTNGGELMAFDINSRQSTNLLLAPLTPDDPFPGPRGICLFEDSAFAFIALSSKVLKVDLNSGVVTTLADSVTGTGDELRNIDSIACNENENLVTTLDSVVRNGGFNSLYDINATTGNRSLRYVFTNGPVTVNPDAIVFEGLNNSILMTSQGDDRSIIRLDDVNQIIPISNSLRGRGPLWSSSFTIAVDEDNARVFAEGFSDRIFLVDIDSGDRVVIAW
jgi:hypothetical protein